MFWTLEETGDFALEGVSGKAGAISSRTGHATWVGTGNDRALRLDGYSVWVEQVATGLPLSSGTLSVSAWVALESFPATDAAILYVGNEAGGKAAFSIDRLGFLQFKVGQGGSSSVCKSAHSLSTGKWMHLAASFGDSGLTVYCDGSPCGTAKAFVGGVHFGKEAGVTLGRLPGCPVTAGVFPTGVLNGLLRDVRVFDEELLPSEIAAIANEAKPEGPPDLEINGAWCVDDPQRPVYHALPPRAWTNEPHGLVYFRGQYHLFYQKNPNGPYWGHIHWGHLASSDLRHWTEMPVALAPEPGPDSEGCWSGSAIEFEDKLVLIYTGGDGSKASICLAMSDDGIHFIKHAGNPIIAAVPQGQGFPEFRDPHVWREGDAFYLIIGSAVKDVGGTALLYRSHDLVKWEYLKPLLVGDHEDSGVFWEMPIFVKLGNQHALIVCEVPGRASYWVGKWKDETFVPHSRTPQRLELLNHLLSPTPLTAADGTVVTMGIIPDRRSSKECWKAGWAHLYSVPRVVTADDRGRLHQAPHLSIEEWFEAPTILAAMQLADGVMKSLDVSSTALNIRVVFERKDSHRATLRLRASENGQEYTDIHYEWAIGRLVMDESHSSLSQPQRRPMEEATYFPDTPDRIEFHVLLDHSVLEVFLDKRAAFATRVYPTLETSTGVALGCDGGAAEASSVSMARLRERG